MSCSRPVLPPERLTEAEREALLETGRAVQREREQAHQAAAPASPPRFSDSSGDPTEDRIMELLKERRLQQSRARAAGLPEPRQAPPQPPQTYSQMVAEREAFMAKFLGD